MMIPVSQLKFKCIAFICCNTASLTPSYLNVVNFKYLFTWRRSRINLSLPDELTGYLLIFEQEPPPVILRNNKSAFEHKDFVKRAIADLVYTGVVNEIDNVKFKCIAFICCNTASLTPSYLNVVNFKYFFTWRRSRINLSLPDDDGLVFEDSEESCFNVSIEALSDLLSAGFFLPNHENSEWKRNN
jgi:hypothetical protein